MNFSTPDQTLSNIEKIGELFPSVITELRDEKGNLKKGINFETLKQLLSPDVVDGEECYEFTWVGKKAAMSEAARPITKTLRPVKEDSRDWETTENLYIEGDNLEVLKILQESYLGKVKMIYIDPPYNTGNDLIYNDVFQQSQNMENENAGMYDDFSNRLFENTSSNGRYHSLWCSMIFSRLSLARNLLSDSGVVFISIDDNEVFNLMEICNQIFGERNYIATYIKQSKVGGGSDSKYIVKEHEYCLVYAKDILCLDEMFVEYDQEYLKRYKEIDEKGRYFWDTFARPGLKNPIYYDIVAPDGTVLNYGWIHGEERFKQELSDGTVRIVPKKTGGWSVQFKQYLNTKGKKPRSMTMDFGGSIEGKTNIGNLFANDKIFSYPKSIKYIQRLLSTINDSAGIVMDFFSGSATTAHAVMQLNAEDGGHRRFIMVQLPEPCGEKTEAYKAGYKNICEIGKERIRRAGDKIKSGHPDADLDIGFRVFRVDESNMKDVYYHPETVRQQDLFEQVSNIKDDRTDMDLLYACLLDWGVEIHLPHTQEMVEGCTVHDVDSGALMACFDEQVPVAVVEHMAKK